MKITYESINKRLGYNFLESIKNHWDNVSSEYDGPSPVQDLTDEEKEFVFKDYLEKKGINL